MATFEEQLTRSAQRIKREDNLHLRVSQNPMADKRTYWGWVATPVAALVGIVFGMGIPAFVGEAESALGEGTSTPIVQVHDTIHVPYHTQDTIYLTKIEERERIVWRDREPAPAPAQPIVQENPPARSEELPQCTSVSCDGIDYSMLVSR